MFQGGCSMGLRSFLAMFQQAEEEVEASSTLESRLSHQDGM